MTYTNIIKTVDKVEGDLIDLGFGKGAVLSSIIESMNNDEILTRNIWLYDSFKGYPKPSKHDQNSFEEGGSNRPIQPAYDIVNTINSHVHIKEGWIEDTLIASHENNSVAIAHLDLGAYESTSFALSLLDTVVKQDGVFIISNYKTTFPGVDRAVDRYVEEKEYSINIADTIGFIYKPVISLKVTKKKVNRTWSSTLT